MGFEARKGGLMGSGGGGQNDQFPVGMRVLAVDDDPTCLKVLEALLLRCRYHVTTTNQATVALKLLRENRDKFDLVISDVHMPDMDGFKLLELVGLEMDLPVIMLSVNGETQSVMKGISHGACDYLLKPVRIEELKNIWQHVVRRKFSHRNFGNFDCREGFETHRSFDNINEQDLSNSELPYQNGNLSRKRKDRNEEDDNAFDENMHENEDPTSHKKPRVVWSIELHRKFVAAVNQLGIDKAVPKRILDLMNVDKLTRENVASHLQKYRLYLKRLSAAASQQATIVAALGGGESSYLHSGLSDRFESFEAFANSRQLPSLTSSHSSGVLGRANTAGIGFSSPSSSEIVHVGHITNNASIPTKDLTRSQQVNLQSNQHASFLQGIPASLELEPLQPTRIPEESNQFPEGFPSSGRCAVIPNKSFVNVTNSNPLALQKLQQQRHSAGFVDCTATRRQNITSDSFHVNDTRCSQWPDIARFNDIRECVLPVSGYPANTSLVSSLTNAEYLLKSPEKLPISPRNNNLPCVSSSSIIMPAPYDPLIGIDEEVQTYSTSGQMMVIPTDVGVETKVDNFSNAGISKQRQQLKENLINGHDVMLNSFSGCTLSDIFMTDPVSGNWIMNNTHQDKGMDKILAKPFNSSQICNIDKSDSDGLAKDKYSVHKVKLHRGLNGSLDDLVSCIIEPERDEVNFAGFETGVDCYSLGACM